MEFTRQEQWDVVVIGCGYAGAMAAIAAHDAGARVVIIEKMYQPGGISICSAGGLRITFDADEAFNYLKATNRSTTPDDILETLADGMATLASKVQELAQAADATVEIKRANANYPFSGHDSFGFVSVSSMQGEDSPSPEVGIRGAAAGYRLFQVLRKALSQRNITVRTNTRARKLITGKASRVCGVIVEHDGKQQELLTQGGVILACGGFEANEEMQRQYWNGISVRSAAFLGNTGDGIKMAQGVGADLWHMWHYHGSYGFHHSDPNYPLAIRTKRYPDWVPGTPPGDDVRMPWILLDKNAKRFMNEYEPYLQDTGARPFHQFDAQTQGFSRIPAWFITDEAGRRRTAFGRPTYHAHDLNFEWSADNLNEVELGILQKADNIEQLASILSVEVEVLLKTLRHWNKNCAAGLDEDFYRPASSMMVIEKPPYYVGRIWPLVNNTQGGPVHDRQQQIINVDGEPISGLYAAGELGSAFGFLYMSGGNLAECFVGGEIAGANAARRALRGANQ
ncbi:MAG: FAD-dependent oxidoreductase [Rhizobiaceae bacterium]